MLDRLPSFKATGIFRKSLATERYLTGSLHEPDGYWQITNQLDKKMVDARAELTEKIKEAVASRNRTRTAPRRNTSVQRRPNRTVQETLSAEYTGPSTRNRTSRGKGRSVAIKDVITPSFDHRFGGTPEERLGSLTGSTASPRQSLNTLLSRFNNKDMGPGFLGASSSRLRGAKNILAHPETWMKRFAPIWIASEVSKGIQRWQGWDKVSFGMEESEARAAMGGTPNAGDVARMALGTEANIALKLLSITAPLGAMAGAAIFGKSQADAANAVATLEQFGSWMSGGFRGDSPTTAIDKYNRSIANAVSNAQLEAKTKAARKFDAQLQEGMVSHKDTLALRGAGGVKKLLGAFKRTPAVVEERQRITAAAHNDVDVNEVIKNTKNRFFGHFD
jgi:hypothetical protein